MKSLIRNFVVFMVALLVVVGTNVAYRSVRADVTSANDENIYLIMVKNKIILSSTVSSVISKYHDAINDFFNDAFSKVVKEKDLEKLRKLISPPEIVLDKDKKPTGVRKPCVDDNLSTYCLAQKGVKEFVKFREAMVYASTLVNQEPVKSIGKDLSVGVQGGTEFNALRNKIGNEIDFAQQALDQGLAAYNEFQMALPLHREYQEIIKSLEAYRDAVAAIRKEVELYPSTFLDVTTTACT